MNRDEILKICQDYRRLDQLELDPDLPARALATEDFPGPGLEKIEPPVSALNSLAGAGRFGWSLLRRCGSNNSLLLNEDDLHARAACIFNFLRGGRKKILLYDVFITTASPLKRILVNWMVRGATWNVLFSRRQVHLYADFFKMPADRFVFVPYKANYSKAPPLDVPMGEYVFSGGNSARDYGTFFKAIEGTGIPCVVSTTRESVLRGLKIPTNVKCISVTEPEYARWVAGSRFVVMPLTSGRIRGHGEQTICNTMWQRRPIIAADDVSAEDYIQEGRTGYVVLPGDVEAMRARIVELWKDRGRCLEMGRQGHEWVAGNFTHDHFLRRMSKLARLLAALETP